MSKNLLKEAIADAKAVRETAIANAKLALEEAFTPKLQSMLSAKLQEDEHGDDEELEDDMHDEMKHEEMEDETEETYSEEDEMDVEDEMDLGEMGHEDDETEEAHHEGTYSEEDEVPGEDEEEDLELEAIIRELEGDEDEEEEEVMEGEHDEMPETDDEDDIDLDEVIRSLSEDEHEDEVEEEDSSDELEEAYNTIKSLKDTLQEVNLLNAKLLFSNKLFKGNDLSESQKMKVIETFDRAANLREVKLVYTTLSESFTGKRASRKAVTEGFASKKSNSTAPKGRIVESNGMADRMKRLAGLL